MPDLPYLSHRHSKSQQIHHQYPSQEPMSAATCGAHGALAWAAFRFQAPQRALAEKLPHLEEWAEQQQLLLRQHRIGIIAPHRFRRRLHHLHRCCSVRCSQNLRLHQGEAGEEAGEEEEDAEAMAADEATKHVAKPCETSLREKQKLPREQLEAQQEWEDRLRGGMTPQMAEQLQGSQRMLRWQQRPRKIVQQERREVLTEQRGTRSAGSLQRRRLPETRRVHWLQHWM